MKKEDEDALIGIGIAILLFLLKNGLPILFAGGGGGKKDKEKDQPPDDGTPRPDDNPQTDITPMPTPLPEPTPTEQPIVLIPYIPTPSPTPSPTYTPTIPPPVALAPEPPNDQPVFVTPPPVNNPLTNPTSTPALPTVDLIDTTVPYYTLITSGVSVTPEIIAASEAQAAGAINVAETSAIVGLGVGAAGVAAATLPAAALLGAAALTGAAGAVGATSNDWQPNRRTTNSYRRRNQSRASRSNVSNVKTPAIQTGSTGFQQPIIKSLFGDLI